MNGRGKGFTFFIKGGFMVPKSVDEQLLFSTVRIEILDLDHQIQGIGTGFFLKVNLDKENSRILLVSNKHVLSKGTHLRLQFHKRNQDTNGPQLGSIYSFIIKHHTEAVIIHPDPYIDLACINISLIISALNNEIYYKFIDESLLATYTEDELDVAQRVTFIGYPDNRFDEIHNLPIIRSGLIASHPKVDFNGIKQFIIDAQVFPGSSGSPVMINLTFENYKNEIVIGRQKIRLLGVVAATMIRYNRIQFMPTNRPPDITVEEAIGLGIVFKTTALRELMDIVAE